MRQNELEEWVLRIAKRVNNNEPIEDSRIELKATWIDPIKAARRIAGHANAAHGEDILWIIGIDEESGVVGAPKKEQHEWLKRVENEFDDIFPELRIEPLAIPLDGDTVIAFLFRTTRAPYVVSNSVFGTPNGGPVEREIPWRSATGIRSAKRSDLIRLLGPVARRPKLEIVSGYLKVIRTGDSNINVLGHYFHSHVCMDLYVTYRSTGDLIIPFHRCQGDFCVLNSGERLELESISLRRSFRGRVAQDTREYTPNVTISPQDAIFRGSGMVQFNANLPDIDVSSNFSEKVNINITLREADTDDPIEILTDFVLVDERKDEYFTYEYNST